MPGVSLETEALAAQLAGQDDRIESALGLHPWHLPAQQSELEAALDALGRALARRRPIALGETGLDKGWRGGAMDLQRLAYRAQVRLALQWKLPLILHCVKAHGACLAVLNDEGFLGSGSPLGMVHDFGGPVQMIPQWVAAGFFLSVSPRALDRVEVLRAIPLEHLLIETDDEGPERLPAVCETLARVREESPSTIAAITERNARQLFGLL